MTGRRLAPLALAAAGLVPGAAAAHDPIHRPPPDWQYPGLDGGPYLTTCYPFDGWPGYRGAFGTIPVLGRACHRPPVPVYAPLPAVFSDAAAVHPINVRRPLGLGLGYYGWVGPYAASPRPKPLSVSVWPPTPGPVAAADTAAACLTVTVRVPVPAAEVFVDGVKTAQAGTDRRFESPPLAAGKPYRYDLTARWVEGGVPVERKVSVTGRAGEVRAVDFADAARAGR